MDVLTIVLLVAAGVLLFVYLARRRGSPSQTPLVDWGASPAPASVIGPAGEAPGRHRQPGSLRRTPGRG